MSEDVTAGVLKSFLIESINIKVCEKYVCKF